MKKKSLVTLLMIPLFFFGVGFICSQAVFPTSNVVEVRASAEEDAFLARFREIRTAQENSKQSICDTTRDEYNELMTLYLAMTEAERNEVNAMMDEYETDATIGSMMKELVRIFYRNNGSNEAPKPKLDQSTTIIIAVVVSIFGMSAISVLYILKKDRYIE